MKRRPNNVHEFKPLEAGASLMLSSGIVDVWRVFLDLRASNTEELESVLSRDECERARRFRIEIHRRRFVAARVALRGLLGAYLRKTAGSLRFEYGAHGKPTLRDPGGIKFNLSHSGDLALIAVTERYELGIDLEAIRTIENLAALGDMVFSNLETRAIANQPESKRENVFYQIWTCKEARLKALGRGLAFNTPREVVAERTERDDERIHYCSLIPVLPGPGYVGALAVRSTSPVLVRAWQYRPMLGNSYSALLKS